MKLAFSTNAFKRYTLEESITSIAEIGYEGVEILCDIPHAYPPTFNQKEIQLIKNLISACSMQISNLNAFSLYAISDVYHPSWIETDKRFRELRLQHTIDCVQLAEKIGATNISTEPGGPVSTNRYYSNFSIGQLERLFIKGLSIAAEVAQKCGIKILVEPEPGLLLENSREFLAFIKNLSYDSVGLNFDISHFYCIRQDPANLVYQLCEYIGHFHLADIADDRMHYHLIPGKGSIDFGSVFGAIEEVGYKGFVTVELYPYQDDPIKAAKMAYNYLNDIIT